MVFFFIRHGILRFQTRLPRIQSFSTSTCRHSKENSSHAFAEHQYPQSIPHNNAQNEPNEETQLAEPPATRCTVNGTYNLGQTERRDTKGDPNLVESSPDILSESYNEGMHSPYAGRGRHRSGNYATSTAQAGAQTELDRSYLASPGKEQGTSFADAKRRLMEAIRLDDPQTLLVEFWEQTKDLSIMAAISSTTFSEIIRLLDRRRDFLVYFREYKERHPKHYWQLTDLDRHFYKTLQDCRTLYRDIWHRRLRAVGHMDVREYAGFLRLARNTWDGEGALLLMKDMLRRDVQPDLICYNLYFEARCWSDMWHPHERQLRRVIPRILDIRQKHPTRTSAGMAIEGYKIEDGGLKAEVTHLFARMIEDGIMPDTTAYGHLITALAREGDMFGVKSILRKVWDIDVDATLEADSESQKTSLIPRDSPVYPSQTLLIILAQAFGSNNDLPTAVRLVDQFSRKFKLRINSVAWLELLEWAFVLSTQRHNINNARGNQLGMLPPKSVLELWDVMTSKPYCIRPEIEMYDLMIRRMWRLQKLVPMLRYMAEGIKIVKEHYQQHRNFVRMKEYLERKGPYGADAKDIAYYKRRVEIADRRRFQSFVYALRWSKLILSRRKWVGVEEHWWIIWERQGLPNAVKSVWRYRRPRDVVRYNMATGFVLLKDLGKVQESERYLDRERGLEHQPMTESQIEAVDKAAAETETEGR